MSSNQLARLVIRLGLGINMFMHGLVRIPKLTTFVTKTAAGFAQTILPEMLTKGFLYALPFFEFTSGLLILIGGQFGKWGYLLGGVIVSALIFGTTLKEDWTGAGNQLIYIIAFYLALRGLEESGRSRTR